MGKSYSARGKQTRREFVRDVDVRRWGAANTKRWKSNVISSGRAKLVKEIAEELCGDNAEMEVKVLPGGRIW